MTYGIQHVALLATVQENRRKPGEVVAFIGGQLCFFERNTPMPKAGETVEVMITRPVHPKDARGYYEISRLTGLMIQVVEPAKHMLLASDGFECAGTMCSTTAFGVATTGQGPIDRKQIWPGGIRGRQMLDTCTVSPGRSGIRYADNVNARVGQSKPTTPTNFWVERDPRTGKALVQPRGAVRVAGLTRIEDLECASIVRAEKIAA